jgi:hypothetical protein
MLPWELSVDTSDASGTLPPVVTVATRLLHDISNPLILLGDPLDELLDALTLPPSPLNERTHRMDPHAREYAGAIAGMTETYGREWRPGDRVRVELPFTGTHGIGIVVELNSARVVVDVDGESLWYYEHELERAEG